MPNPSSQSNPSSQPNPSSQTDTLRTVSDLLHHARLAIRDGGQAVAMFEIDTLLQVAQTEVARSLERADR